MEISPRKPSKRAQEPVDEWLQAKGYFRKHAPRDPTCLFRAVSEQVYMTQHYHLRVRKECVAFMRTMKQSFFENIAIPLDDYLDQMTCFTEWGGINEIQAMSLLYKRDFVILNGQKQVQRNVTNNGFKDVIYLCHTPQKQYESIYTQDFVASAAYCQSIVYQVLYKGVFNMANLETTVHKMLHDRTANFRHDKFFLKGNLEIRERLTTEIYNKVESGNDELDDAQGVTKNIPPFPYRVAKALDPNIYRNTDFDIWYEIRKEVKNAGWTRHNSHELQVGGKCLIQMDFNENDFDRANNKNVYVSSIEKDVNYNDTKALQKTDKQDPIFLYGHIQEMSKNQGPVLVFIEELGEKKIVPYCALKPLPLKKSKQNNWVPMCKRNVLVDSNQKWKKPYGTASRKMKQSISSVTISSGSIDKNGNNDNCTDSINKNNIQWRKESLKEEPTQAYENYELEKYTNYSANAPSEMYPARPNLDNTESLALNSKQENDNGYKEKNSFGKKNFEKHSAKNLKSENTMNTDNNTGFDSYPNQRTQNENFYSPYSDEPISAAQVDNMLRSINCSVQKSVDVNGSDLPLSDPFTLRFFYNLGLECFRGSNNWNYLTNEQSSGVGQWYQGMPQNEVDATTITNGMMQHCTVSPQKPEHNNDHKESGSQSHSQENGEKCVNGKKDAMIQKPEEPKVGEGKDVSQLAREKIKDQEPVNRDSPRPTRNGLGPRFKKNSDNRHRTGSQFAQQCNQYSYCGGNSKSTKSHETKNDNFQQSRAAPQQVHGSPTAAVNSYQTPYMQQGMYSGIPYYANEAEAFANPYYPPSPGFFPMPCLPHSDIPDNGNMQQFSPHLCPGMDYAQAYPGVCPPYMCPQPAPYSVPPQNMQEHWYAVAGQPHYMPYAPVMPVAADGVCNGLAQNVNQNTPTPECITMQLCSNL